MIRRPPLAGLGRSFLLRTALLGCLLGGLPTAAAAFTSLDDSAPLEVEASQGIEWRREQGTVVARGDAVATQGKMTVRADELTAYYQDTPSGGNRIYRFEATGNVRVSNGENRLFGPKVTYDVDGAIFTVAGGKSTLETPSETIVANEGMEYRSRERIASARGDVVAVRGPRKLRADQMTAEFAEGPDGAMQVIRIDASGEVLIATAKEVVRANKAVYHPEQEKVELNGNVRVTRGRTELAGAQASLDLRSGVSRLEGGGGSGGSGRARAVFMPESRGQ